MTTLGDELKKFVTFCRRVWAGSMGIVIALVIGVYKAGDIIDDCKYSGSFRVHSQAFNCQRKI